MSLYKYEICSYDKYILKIQKLIIFIIDIVKFKNSNLVDINLKRYLF